MNIPKWKRYNLRHPERRKASYEKYRLKNRTKRNAQRRDWGVQNKDRIRVYMVEWLSKQPAKFWNRWPSRQPQRNRKPGRSYEQQLQANRLCRAQACKDLRDSYLRGWMSRTTGNIIKPSEWPADLVELKRAQLKVKRLCRESQTTTNCAAI